MGPWQHPPSASDPFCIRDKKLFILDSRMQANRSASGQARAFVCVLLAALSFALIQARLSNEAFCPSLVPSVGPAEGHPRRSAQPCMAPAGGAS